jgi:hypothetical protein
LGSYVLIFQSEIYATLACSKYCIMEGIVNRVVSIFSDSRAFECQVEGAGVVTQIILRLMELGVCLSSVKNVAEKTQSRLDKILTEAA